jgi:hypothetical protein
MGISFSFKNNVQYVKIDGPLSQVEEAAVRLKLDQKINQGRNKILIDITSFATTDKDSVKALHSVLNFAIHRGTAVALFGIKQTLWLPVAEGFPTKLTLFETEGEAVSWSATVEVKPLAVAGKKPDPEAEIKEKKLKELLGKYEIYQAKNDYDPYLLKKLELEYAKAPQRESLFALRRAYKHLSTLKESMDQVDAHCRKLADQLLEATIIRKIPLTPAELSLKAKSIQDAKAAVELEVREIKSQIDQNMNTAVDFRKRSKTIEERWTHEIDFLQNQIAEQTAENKKVLLELQALSD